MDLEVQSPFCPYTILPSGDFVTISIPVQGSQHVEKSAKFNITFPEFKATGSVPRTNYDIYNEGGSGIPISNFKLLAAWVKYCEHSAAEHGVNPQNSRFCILSYQL